MIVFETARASGAAAPQRTDIACFIGYVGRTPAPLPPQVTADLRAAGWIDGPWRLGDAQVRALDNLPVIVESWEAFDALFDWRSRPLSAAGTTTCATYLGAAVRRFFAQGGRRAIVVRAGNPWPFLEEPGTRAANRVARIRGLLPTFAGVPAPLPFDSTDPGTWRGIQHLYGLPEVSLVCLPDLPDACADDPPQPASTLPLVPVSEGFVECSVGEAPPDPDVPLRLQQAPRCNGEGLAGWTRAVGNARDFLARHRRDVVLVAAPPLAIDRSADREPLDYHVRQGVFAPDGDEAALASSAFVQLAAPWLSTRESIDLPQALEPADGLLAGVIAAAALARGTFRSVAGTLLPAVVDTEPRPSWGLTADAPWARLAERVCLVARQPDGWALQSDVTTSPDRAWRAGGASRMLASLLRAARAAGEVEMFDANGPALWTRVRRHIEALLTEYWQEGGLGGATPDDAFEVRCDRSTITQADLDAGRLVARITVLPVAAVERITVVLALSASGPAIGGIREVA